MLHSIRNGEKRQGEPPRCEKFDKPFCAVFVVNVINTICAYSAHELRMHFDHVLVIQHIISFDDRTVVDGTPPNFAET